MNLKDTTIAKMNELGSQRIPFLFIIDFEEQNSFISPLAEIDKNQVQYDFNHITNTTSCPVKIKPELSAYPISYQEYLTQFEIVKDNIQKGNSYLLNLTIQTPIELNCSLEEIFHSVSAKYKLLVKGKFTCFSPEIFVKIKDNRIYSFPMKGTIDANLLHAKEILLNDAKENAEHYTIVDLIRNDLNIVAKRVKVDRFKYLDKIHTSKGSILQMSSQISGDLNENWHQHIGDLFQKILPAGSITGSPKEKTIEIINQAESYNRNFYTGIAGIYDGENLDSGVLIRFIEKQGDNFYYKSGGGITYASDPRKEYEELLQKIYIPVS
ncbi:MULTISPECIES: aminodeoxychorismate synthase component I [Myroides]|uniref:Aminodeoxychorismate synthase component I n=1 Tax=Myroides albus TaxID=2562892 RepID=A0A6I3LMM3_9FLAO|nr:MULTISPECIES: aminodeoxychorismate synthase component I [Myroides]MTG98746.1 aminodeoxychorismate synthase component I [Myroides albus]MVX36606.1 aminodeoxychorismate synthase component I [Myroides sp. LoEW2-1]UVD79936.1 aminodeoxychorismate synthase component I [Myroides albus]